MAVQEMEREKEKGAGEWFQKYKVSQLLLVSTFGS